MGESVGLLEAVGAINEWIYRNIRYIKGSTSLVTTPQQVLESRVGVCQDMTHLSLGMLRGLKIPARYVCGLMAPDVGETHAWIEFRHPQQGWIPADPSRGLPLADRGDMVKFAVGRDFFRSRPGGRHLQDRRFGTSGLGSSPRPTGQGRHFIGRCARVVDPNFGWGRKADKVNK